MEQQHSWCKVAAMTSPLVTRGLAIVYSPESAYGGAKGLIGALVEFSYELVVKGGITDLTSFFKELDVVRVREFYILPLILRSFYAYNTHVPNWLDVYHAVANELDNRGQNTKRLLRGSLHEPYQANPMFPVWPILKNSSP